MSHPKYFVYRTSIYNSGGGLRQSKLVSSMPAIKSPMQTGPYGVDFELTYQINPRFTPPDNYVDSHGFSLYSKKLVDILEKYKVGFEKIPVKMTDLEGKELPDLEYFAFHLLERYQDVIDEKASGYDKNNKIEPIKSLVLDYSKFEFKPMFVLDKVYFPLMREDLKSELEKNQITGFTFEPADNYSPYKFNFKPGFKLN